MPPQVAQQAQVVARQAQVVQLSGTALEVERAHQRQAVRVVLAVTTGALPAHLWPVVPVQTVVVQPAPMELARLAASLQGVMEGSPM